MTGLKYTATGFVFRITELVLNKSTLNLFLKFLQDCTIKSSIPVLVLGWRCVKKLCRPLEATFEQKEDQAKVQI
ncbi:hypothetical protein D9M71_807740 [compost metagenome]